jgi:hypothetical protein
MQYLTRNIYCQKEYDVFNNYRSVLITQHEPLEKNHLSAKAII